MSNINNIVIRGHISSTAGLKYLPSKTPVLTFGLASNRQYTDRNGVKQSEVCFVDCNIFGKYAESINQYITKGTSVIVTGRLTFRQWESQGGRHSKHEINVDNLELLPRNGNGAPAPTETEPAELPGPVDESFNLGDDSPV